MGIISDCRQGIIPKEVEIVATREGVSPESLMHSVVEGLAVVTSTKRGIDPVGIGEGLRAKFATIVGTSSFDDSIDSVIKKAKVAIECGASVIHNGSAAGNIERIHRLLLDNLEIPIAFCEPLRVATRASFENKDFMKVETEEFMDLLELDASSGVEILVVPMGVSIELVEKLKEMKRLMPSPNKTGSLMVSWIAHNKTENPYRVQFDRILKIAKEHDVILSFINGFRPGCIADCLDYFHLQEFESMKELVQHAKEAGVQVKVGSGGHIPLNKIKQLFRYQKELLNVPIISFGPQVTDTSIAYDHISAAIGQAQALMCGADIIFSITPAEHLALPNEDETREGCISAKIVCNSVDIARGKDMERENDMSIARESLDWDKQLSFAPYKIKAEKIRWRDSILQACSLCGDSCPHLLANHLNKSVSEILSSTVFPNELKGE